MATPNPSAHTFDKYTPPQISTHHFTIAGILVRVYGLDELPSPCSEVACMWLLHARLQTQAAMEPIAAVIIHDWNKRIRERRAGSEKRPIGLIGVSFDQRNHGSRQVDERANEAWRSRNSNPTHAQDMFSSYRGTAIDASLLIDHLPSYLFTTSNRKITQHIVLGLSLGAHASWHVLFHDPRVTTAVICIGCPDYIRMMSDRARLSKVPSYVSTNPPGKDFLGGKDFPPNLIEQVKKYDPAALLLGQLDAVTAGDYSREPSAQEKQTLLPLMKKYLAGKRILNLSGAADKMAPPRVSDPFLSWLRRAVCRGGWFSNQGVVFEDVRYKGLGHEVTMPMVWEMARFISDTLAARGGSGSIPRSKL